MVWFFLKERLKERKVSPVLYLNNTAADIDNVFYGLFSLIATSPAVAEHLLPLISVFGQKVHPMGAPVRPPGLVDFTWEREWRRPAAIGDFEFDDEDIFCGLCPHEEIANFEFAYASIRFIDPLRSMKWYAQALIESRHRVALKYSVV